MNSQGAPADPAPIRSGEDSLIQRWFAPIAGPAGLGLKDDAACLTPPPGCDLVVTADALIAGIHFFPDDPPDAIARKALRVNLSDLAAKGAAPLGCLLSLALPAGASDAFLEAFSRGLGEDVRGFSCPLIGGDTVTTPGPLMVAITALGSVPWGRMVRRDGARPGDVVFVTGTIGDAALGLVARLDGRFAQAMTDAHRAHVLDRYLLPRPRIALAAALRDHASAAMDVSDGLSGDLAKLCAVSGVGAAIQLAAIPFSEAAAAAMARRRDLRMTALTGGDDYEILGACRPHKWSALKHSIQVAGGDIRQIGVATLLPNSVVFFESNGSVADIPLRGYSHPGQDSHVT